MYMTADTSIISAARKRYTREQLGAEDMSDCWSDLTDKVTISRWRKTGTGVTFKRDSTRERKWNEGSDGKVQSGRRTRAERASGDSVGSFMTSLGGGMITPTTAMVLSDPAKGRWLSKIVEQLDAVKELADTNTVAALNGILDPLKDELSMLGQLSQLVSQNGTPRESRDPSVKAGDGFKEVFRKNSQDQLAVMRSARSASVCSNDGSDKDNKELYRIDSADEASLISSPRASQNASLHKGTAMSSPNASLHRGTAMESPAHSASGTPCGSKNSSLHKGNIMQSPGASPNTSLHKGNAMEMSASGDLVMRSTGTTNVQPGSARACRSQCNPPSAAPAPAASPSARRSTAMM